MTEEKIKRLLKLALSELDAVGYAEPVYYGLTIEEQSEFIELLKEYKKENE